MENPASLRARSVHAVATHPKAAALALGLLVVLVVVLLYRSLGFAGAAAKSSFASGGRRAAAEGPDAPAPEPTPPAPAPAPAPKPGPCRRQWSPAAIAEAQGLATAGGLGYFDCSYGESQLVSAANFENDSRAGLTDEALMGMARFGAAP